MPVRKDPELNKAFGSALRRVRLARDLSQDEVDYLLGQSHGHLGRYENGRLAPGLIVLMQLAGCLETSIDELVPLGDQRTHPRHVAHPADLPTVEGRSEIAAITAECAQRIRLKRNLTRPELAAASDLSEHIVNRIEGIKTPTSIPGLVPLVRLSKALNVNPIEFTGGIRYVPDSGRRENLSRGRRTGFSQHGQVGVFVRTP